MTAAGFPVCDTELNTPPDDGTALPDERDQPHTVRMDCAVARTWLKPVPAARAR